jgi:hypothetical protein
MTADLNYARELDRLIELWDKHSTRAWEVPSERHGLNVALVNAFASHSINLARGVRALTREGLTFESISLVRSTMECAATAAWLALYPEKTSDFTLASAGVHKKTLDEMVEKGFSDGGPGLIQSAQFLAGRDMKSIDPEGKYLQRRFESMRGGDELYLTYRVLCGWDHATSSLADEYVVSVDQSEENPWGLVLRNEAASRDPWTGMEAALVLRAQIAADMVLSRPRHRTQLRNFARRFGVSELVEPASMGATGA